MNLRIKPWSKNTYPLQGILIKGTDLKYWLYQLQILEIDINEVPVFAIQTILNYRMYSFANVLKMHYLYPNFLQYILKLILLK